MRTSACTGSDTRRTCPCGRTARDGVYRVGLGPYGDRGSGVRGVRAGARGAVRGAGRLGARSGLVRSLQTGGHAFGGRSLGAIRRRSDTARFTSGGFRVAVRARCGAGQPSGSRYVGYRSGRNRSCFLVSVAGGVFGPPGREALCRAGGGSHRRRDQRRSAAGSAPLSSATAAPRRKRLSGIDHFSSARCKSRVVVGARADAQRRNPPDSGPRRACRASDTR